LWRQHETIDFHSAAFSVYRLNGGGFGCVFPRHLRSCPAGREVRDLLMSNVRIIHGDCMEAMKAMPDKAYEDKRQMVRKSNITKARYFSDIERNAEWFYGI
jgi:hypothetical protein